MSTYSKTDVIFDWIHNKSYIFCQNQLSIYFSKNVDSDVIWMKNHFDTLFDDVETRGNSKCKQKCIKNYKSNKKKIVR